MHLKGEEEEEEEEEEARGLTTNIIFDIKEESLRTWVKKKRERETVIQKRRCWTEYFLRELKKEKERKFRRGYFLKL